MNDMTNTELFTIEATSYHVMIEFGEVKLDRVSLNNQRDVSLVGVHVVILINMNENYHK